MYDYIPSKEPAKILRLWNIAKWLTADNGANTLAHGLTWEKACGFYSAVIL
jgi:hypothetical protein